MTKRKVEFVICPGRCKQLIRSDWGHACPPLDKEEVQLIEQAWGLIANAGYGNWDNESTLWKDAAARWRDRFHAYLSAKDQPQERRTDA